MGESCLAFPTCTHMPTWKKDDVALKEKRGAKISFFKESHEIVARLITYLVF